MSDYKPITGELRNYMKNDRGVCYMSEECFDRLCDAIDSIHSGLERENAALKAERNGIEPPKDADGKTINANDEMEWLNGTKHGRVTGIGVGEFYGWVWVLVEGKYVSIAMLASDLHHHHHLDTWESIINESYMRGVKAQQEAQMEAHGCGTDAFVSSVEIPDDYDLVIRCKALCERTKEDA